MRGFSPRETRTRGPARAETPCWSVTGAWPLRLPELVYYRGTAHQMRCPEHPQVMVDTRAPLESYALQVTLREDSEHVTLPPGGEVTEQDALQLVA